MKLTTKARSVLSLHDTQMIPELAPRQWMKYSTDEKRVTADEIKEQDKIHVHFEPFRR